MAPLEEFFAKESEIVKAGNTFIPELEDFEGFSKSAIHQDQVGNHLVHDSQHSAAMFLRMYAHEHYARFQQTLINQFSDRLSENWKIYNDYKKNAIKIW
jgi:hypothetical protein